jgi:hypothetical protein
MDDGAGWRPPEHAKPRPIHTLEKTNLYGLFAAAGQIITRRLIFLFLRCEPGGSRF